MQWMHWNYKFMKAQKKLSGCASNLLAHEDLGHLRKPIVGIYKPSSIMKNSHQYMKVTTQEILYHEDHGATLNHKYGKRIVTLPLLSFSLIISMASLASFSNLGFIGLSFFPHMGQFSNNDDHHTFIYLQLNITTRYQNKDMTLYECLRWCTGMCNDLAQQRYQKMDKP